MVVYEEELPSCNQPCTVFATDARLLLELNAGQAMMTCDVPLQVRDNRYVYWALYPTVIDANDEPENSVLY